MKVEEDDLPMRRVWKVAGILAAVGTLIAVLGASAHSDAFFGIGLLTIFLGIMGVLNAKFFVPATNWFQFHWLPRLEARYERFLRYALDRHHPRTFLFGTFGLLLLAFILLGLFPPKTLFFPENEPAYINAFIEAPIGTDILKTDSITRLIEKQVMEVIDVPEFKVPPGTKMPDGTVTQDSVNFLVNSVIAQVGEGTSDPAEGGMPVGATPNKGRVAISFVKFADRHGLLTTDVLPQAATPHQSPARCGGDRGQERRRTARGQAHQHRDQG
jgi:multidrug efflux pump